MIHRYDRHSQVEIDPVLQAIASEERKAEFNGQLVGVESLRLQTFLHKGTVCVACGLKASHFNIERDWSAAKRGAAYHLNLYGIDEEGEEVLFTKDHIHPKSCGGKDVLENMQTMCSPCNNKKGATIA